MSVDGLTFLWRDVGTIGGNALALTAGDPQPAVPYSQTTGLITVTVEASETVTLWAAASSPLSTFDFLYVMAGDYPDEDNLADDGTTPELVGNLTLVANVGDGNEKSWIEPLREACPYRRFSNVAYDAADAASTVGQLTFENTDDEDVTIRLLLAKA